MLLSAIPCLETGRDLRHSFYDYVNLLTAHFPIPASSSASTSAPLSSAPVKAPVAMPLLLSFPRLLNTHISQMRIEGVPRGHVRLEDSFSRLRSFLLHYITVDVSKA